MTELKPDVYMLKLFVAGEGARTSRAVENIRQICSENLEGKFQFEVIDITENPQAAEEHRIIAVPTLVKEEPLPAMRLIGDMSETRKVLEGLNIPRAS